MTVIFLEHGLNEVLSLQVVELLPLPEGVPEVITVVAADATRAQLQVWDLQGQVDLGGSKQSLLEFGFEHSLRKRLEVDYEWRKSVRVLEGVPGSSHRRLVSPCNIAYCLCRQVLKTAEGTTE